MNKVMQLDQQNLPKRFGLSERAIKISKLFLISFGGLLLIFGALLLFADWISALIIMLFGGIILWVGRRASVNYVEVTREGLRQGKTFISWKDMSQVEETKVPLTSKIISVRTKDNTIISLESALSSIVPLHELESFLTLVVKQAQLVEKKTDIEYIRPGEELIRVWAKPQSSVQGPFTGQVDFPPFNWSHRAQKFYAWGALAFSCSILLALGILGNDWIETHITLTLIFAFAALTSLFTIALLAAVRGGFGLKKGFILALLLLIAWGFLVPLWIRMWLK